ncbi:carboxypeptidase-like regulatory domain-containing protein [Rubrivirga sp. IMCC43871]|uniref:carboxypeptidase-like regulatory domain-containing protein n=1 Tax=Rubrivirga sp. IMCC43871 TaxID=3391575 RepID=UPI00398FF9E5
MTFHGSGWALVLFVALAASTPPTAAAQTVRVEGRVVDAETDAPLPGVNVFVSGTTRGDATDRDGAYAFEIEGAGPFAVSASILGYETAHATVAGGAEDAETVAFRLAPAALGLGAVEVVTEADEDWLRAVDVFERVFLGATPNAQRTTIVDPERIDAALTVTHGLRATAASSFTVRNDALGFDLAVFDFALVADGSGTAWDGTLFFQDLCAPACAPKVEAAREAAYRGSRRHFARALLAGTLEAEGFVARRVREPGAGESVMGFVRRKLFRRPDDARVGPDDVVSDGDGGRVEIGGAIRVEYHGERDGRPDGGDTQVSWLAADDGVLRLRPDGRFADPAAVQHFGYWDWERVADLLPLDYVPRRD